MRCVGAETLDEQDDIMLTIFPCSSVELVVEFRLRLGPGMDRLLYLPVLASPYKATLMPHSVHTVLPMLVLCRTCRCLKQSTHCTSPQQDAILVSNFNQPGSIHSSVPCACHMGVDGVDTAVYEAVQCRGCRTEADPDYPHKQGKSLSLDATYARSEKLSDAHL